MANISCIHIRAKVPFNYLLELSDKDAAFLARILLSPAVGLQYRRRGTVEWRPNQFGGRTAIELIEISGKEALNLWVLDKLKEIFERSGDLELFSADDIEFEDGAKCRICGASF